MSVSSRSFGTQNEVVATLKHALGLLDELGLAYEAALVLQALEGTAASLIPATRAGGE